MYITIVTNKYIFFPHFQLFILFYKTLIMNKILRNKNIQNIVLYFVDKKVL